MQTNSARWGNLILMLALLFGAIVRLAPTIIAGVPINDGGMFYTMIQEIVANGFWLPVLTSYNHLGIPFAYPPLSLYAGAILSAHGIPTMNVLRWLPALASTGAILAFYWMAARMLGSRSKAAMAAAFFALMPRSFSWYVMGGGLSRSFGILFLLLTCGSAWSMFSKPTWRSLWLTILCGAAAVLSHPETALHATTACALIGLFRGRSVRGLRDAALVAGGVIVLTSPWWGTVIARHGLGAFASALHTGGHGGPFLITWLTFSFAQEPFVAVLTAISLVGLTVQIRRREWFLPVWTLVPFAAEPRSGPAIAILPLAMLGAIGMTEFVLPRLASRGDADESGGRDWTDHLSRSASARIVTGAVLLYAFFAAFAYALSLVVIVVPIQSRLAAEWIQQNTPRNARFLVLTGETDPFSDSTAEWFPALTGRASVNTPQGREWQMGAAFMPFLGSLGSLEGCLNGGPSCINDWTREYRTGFDYVYIQGRDGQQVVDTVLLAYELKHDPDYQVVYDEGDVTIFGRR